ncbi:RsmB/NOP family class I SAM-dependent RNA methyltransferase [Sphingomonas sp. LaA6.9]|uniref:RsmB/NOP family class I SAM-dependent RNA methyltransferase n=1 Tax=Sphingomonas sp. LaA6.9 TaxID=2919914 RepID=UPI001F4FA9F0|nr:transcription antitermination factor NusB [Sphingomonas sp. LaA6.9]MCJ8156311.1 SAM-dependent methyltransferase [Sphingomonas sp. LaA6.9]
MPQIPSDRQKARYPAPPPGMPARRAALKLLDAVIRRGQPLEAALGAATQGISRPDDRALAHAIAAETLRRLPDLDALIDSATAKPLPEDAKARFALRIALVQALALGTPGHAAIATVLPLVDGGPRRLVHGVFGSLLRKGVSLPEVPQLLPDVAARWEADWGAEMVAGAASAIAAPPPLDLTLVDAAETQHWVAELGGTSLMPGHVRLTDAGPVTSLPGFEQGRWWVQDLAASLPARLLGRGDGTALDLCAAPGGKALQLAAAGWKVTALDRSAQRLERVRENAGRTGLPLDVREADVMRWAPEAPVGAILLDAPCSATGIFRRHPDVLHRVRPRDIAEMAELQGAMLARAVDWLIPGGTLVYATCSLEPAEGEAQIEKLLRNRDDIALTPITAADLPANVPETAQGWVRTLPGMLADAGGLDGFFIARLTRKG